jgi:hypothetical protein
VYSAQPSQPTTLSRAGKAPIAGFLLGALAIATVVVCLLALAARSQVQDLGNLDARQLQVLGAILAAACVFWVVVIATGRRVLNGIGVPMLAMLGMIAGLRFAVAFGSVVVGLVFNAILGDLYSAFLRGIGDEMFPSLLLAVAIVLRPKFGTATFLLLAHFLLNVIYSGTFGLIAIAYASISIALNEMFLATLGITVGGSLREPRMKPTPNAVVRLSLAIGAAKGITYYIQFVLYQFLFRLFFPEWQVLVLCLVTGAGYAFIGAAFGTSIGYRLRRVSL